MIRLTRLNHIPLIVNADLIEHIDMTPDTVVTLISGQKFMVLESAEEVVDKFMAFRRALTVGGPTVSSVADGSGTSIDTETLSHGR